MKNGWKELALSEVFDLDLDSAAVDPSKSFEMVGVLSYGRGLFVKPSVDGSETSYKTFFRLNEGQIVLSQLFGWEGAIAPVEKEFVGRFVSSQFPTFRPKTNLNSQFAKWMIRLPQLWDQLKNAAKGMGDRRRTLSPDIFLAAKAALPPFDEQKNIASHLDTIEERLDRVRKLREEQENELLAALRSVFHRVVSTADWIEMGEVAPLVRRPVEIEPDGQYPELGARSFGKGIFHKPTLYGSQLTWQKLFEIHAGDIVISNIKAWEGAIAVASKSDHGRAGSHRYLTCVTNIERAIPDFICFYLLTNEGLEQIGQASPGSADRNRTLAAKRLEKIKVPIPSMKTQLEFMKLMKFRQEIQKNREKSLRHSDALLPSLLDRIFNGS